MDLDVIIPVYNGARLVGRAVDSVRAQDVRGGPRILCVDDGSTDGSREVLSELSRTDDRIEVLSTPGNCGVGVARNVAIGAGSSEFVAFLDQDDEWTVGSLARRAEVLRREPDVGFVVGLQQLVLDEGIERPGWVRPEWLVEPQAGYIPSALLVRRSVIERVGLFDESFHAGGDDTDWFARARRMAVQSRMVDDVVFHRYVHAYNVSADPRTSDDLLRVVRTHVRGLEEGS